MKKTCIIIAGSTAIGKTAIAVDLASHFNTEIISADSRQCFRELSIGVAKPSTEELKTVHHYFVDSHSIHDQVTAAVFESYALDAINNIFLKNDIAIMCGGTGLYIRAFCNGLDPIPAINEEVRTRIINTYNNNGLVWLQKEVMEKDPLFFNSGEADNPQRLMRALEVIESTGRSITTFQSGNKKPREFDIIKICLEMPRDKLYDRINARVDQMINMGLEQEAQELLPFRQLNSLQTVGYRELFGYFDGEYSLEHAISLIKQNSRNYAKRQLTWFRKENMTWMDVREEKLLENIISIAERRNASE